jgi:hypothetical protein
MDVSCWDMTQTPAIPDDILAALDTLPNSARPVLVRLRGVIFDVASTVPGAGDVSETLSTTVAYWGEFFDVRWLRRLDARVAIATSSI